MRKWTVVALIAVGLAVPSANGFGGEDLIEGQPWHHQDITMRALQGDELYEPKVKFGAGADAVAWHADYIDSYLYSPLFLLQGFTDTSAVDRTRASLAGYDNLVKLHFDDINTGGSIAATWERYAAGTLAGLYWASEQGDGGDVAAGHHILGVSLHAIQDFYAHSTWVNSTERRCETYLQMDPDERRNEPLKTGAYESPRSSASTLHGGYSLACSALRGEYTDVAMDLVCASLSPAQNTSLCQRWRTCADAVPIEVDAVIETDSLVYLEEPGIALDNTSFARISAVTRKLTLPNGEFASGRDGLHIPKERCQSIINAEDRIVCESAADQVFAANKDLAIRASMEWVEWLEAAMQGMGKGAYWERLKSEDADNGGVARLPIEAIEHDVYPNRYAQFENFTKLPYQFLAAGPYPELYPSDLDREKLGPSDGWYLRLRIKTADELWAGTDADIYADVRLEGGTTRKVLLDYMPTKDKEGRANHPFIVFNDFERGADDVYTIGPFHDRPISIQLRNDATDFGEVIEAATRDIVTLTDGFISTGGGLLTSIVGGEADFVGATYSTFEYEIMKRRLGATGSFDQFYTVDGGSEGHHKVKISFLNQPQRRTQQEVDEDWLAVELRLETIETIEEAELDRGSDSDEPFVIFRAISYNGRDNQAYTYLSDPFQDMDDGDVEPFPRTSLETFMLRIPKDGAAVTSLAIYESDDETLQQRRNLRDEFVTGLDEETRQPALELMDAFGASIAEDWSPDWIEVFAFERGMIPEAGPVLERTPLTEIRGDETSEDLIFDWSRQHILIGSDTLPISRYQSAAPTADEVLEGEWFSQDYWCEGRQPYQRVQIDASGTDGRDVAALKTEAIGDNCVGANEATFRGRFEDNQLVGERYTVPPPFNRPKEKTDPPHPLDPVPNYYNPLIHPRLDLEGNWVVAWSNTPESPAFVELTKGGKRECPTENGGCWFQFLRDPTAEWMADYYQSGEDLKSLNKTSRISMSNDGDMEIRWNSGQFGRGAARSFTQAASTNRLSGIWRLGDEQEGHELWMRVRGKANSIAVVTDSGERRVPIGTPLPVETKFRTHIDRLRANRESVILRIYGTNLWGRHYIHLPWSSDLEISGFSYICADKDGRGSDTTTAWKSCFERGGVIGIEAIMKVWWRAQSQQHILTFDNVEIPLDLTVIDEPQRFAEWQDMKMEFRSCSVLQEVDRPHEEHPFRLVRSDFTK